MGIWNTGSFEINKFYFHVQKITILPHFDKLNCNHYEMKTQYLESNLCKNSEPKM